MLRNTKVGVVKRFYGHTAGLIRDNFQQRLAWGITFARRFMVQFTSNEVLSNDTP